ncbi:MAG: amino acid adenylation domain-containing protein, partial [Saprospiraceae bacterium]
ERTIEFKQFLQTVAEKVEMVFAEPNKYGVDRTIPSVLFSLQQHPGLSDFKENALTQNNFALDVALEVSLADSEAKVQLSYASELFAATTMSRLVTNFELLLKSIVAKPTELLGDLEMLSTSERNLLLDQFNSVGRSYTRDKTVLDLFAAQVKRTPDRVALKYNGEELSYAELDQKSNQLAHFLQTQGVKEETLVGLCVDRSFNMAITIFGITKTGAAYVPLDPTFPQERINFILEDTSVKYFLCQDNHVPLFAETVEREEIALFQLEQIEEQLNAAPMTPVTAAITTESLFCLMYTSGSTGKPKGVMDLHGSLAIRMEDEIALKKQAVINGFMYNNYVFDLFLTEFLIPLLSGGNLLIPKFEDLFSLEAVIDLIAANGVTNLQGTPTFYGSLMDALAADKISSLDRMERFDVCGESLTDSIVQKVRTKLPHVNITNFYGPTEAAVYVTAVEAVQAMSWNNIGVPLANAEIYIVDEHNRPLPINVVGELLIGGDGLARGYFKRPDLTAERFIPHPFKQEEGARLYKSGDLARWLPNGTLEFFGRMDDQVQLNGWRVELGEIEVVLQQSPMINKSAVLVKSEVGKQQRLIAYVTVTEDYSEEAVRAYLLAKLPSYMIPTVIMNLEEMPLTPSKKIDKISLSKLESSESLISKLQTRCQIGLPTHMQPTHYCLIDEIPQNLSDKVDEKALLKIFSEQDHTELLEKKNFIAPRNETEEVLADIWQHILKVENIGVHDNFFELGGHSLLATRLVAAIRKRLGKEIAIREIFLKPTIDALAAYLSAASGTVTLPKITAQDRPENIPLSFAQERLWFIDQLEGSSHYHLPAVQYLGRDVNQEALASAFQKLVNRHEVLRTVFREEEGQAYQLLLPENSWHLQYAALPPTEVNARIETEINRAFDLAKDHMLRATLVKMVDGDYLLILVVHHIASDGWSTPILLEELLAFYQAALENRSADLAPLAIQYADYAMWQRQHLAGDLLDQKLAYWEEQLKELDTLNIPTDFPRPNIQSLKGKRLSFTLEQDLSAQLQSFAQQEGVTMFMLMLTLLKVLLHRYTGQSDIAIGSPVANRTQAEVENLIGFFINTLTLRSDLSGNPLFKELLAQVKTETLTAYDHQDVPFEKIVDRVVKGRDLSRSPLFQVLFAYGNEAGKTMEDAFATNTVAENDAEQGVAKNENFSESIDYEVAKFDLSVNVSEEEGSLVVSLLYCSDLFLASTIERMGVHFNKLIRTVVANPTQSIQSYPMLTEEEMQQLLVDFNKTATTYPENRTLIDLFNGQLNLHPNKAALSFAGTTLTYQDLEDRSNQLAHFLVESGVQEEDLICICLDRSIEMIVSLLAVLKASAAYVPIAPDYPQQRINFIVADTKAKVVITDKKYQSTFAENEEITMVFVDDLKAFKQYPTTAPSTKPAVNNLAYIIYTSGSTGKPKGVEVEHASVVNELCFYAKTYGVEHSDRHLLLANYVFDASVEQIFLPLTHGVHLDLVSKMDMLDPVFLDQFIKEKGITHLHGTPALLQTIRANTYESVKRVCAGGELCTEALAQSWGTKVQFFNKYGPTETTISSSYHLYDPSADYTGALPIGQPIANTRYYILDEHQQPLPIGVVGELYIGGKGMTRGYLNRPELTTEKFIVSPFNDGETLYRTGDLVRWTATGEVEFKGRQDDQVKVRGYRIELGEIETVLLEAPMIDQAVVMTKQDAMDQNILVAYVVPKTSNELAYDKTTVQAYLASALPDYMLPSFLIELTEFPVAASGKVDRKALPEINVSAHLTDAYVAPTTDTEEKLAEIWSALLKVEKIGVHNDFFELGGHSLLAIRMVATIRTEMQKEVPIREIFLNPTVAQLANFIATITTNDLLPAITPTERPTLIPLSFAQERLWFIDQLEGSAHYHIPVVQSFGGDIDKDILEFALQTVVNRHEVLRTVYKEVKGTAYQEILEPNQWTLAYEEVTTTAKTAVEMLVASEIDRPFDLSQDHMLRAKLIKLSEEEYLLVLVMHHIASDAWSGPILFNELMELYEAKQADRLPELKEMLVQYADYSLWQRKYLTGELLDQRLAYWENKLADVELLNLPTDFARPVIQSKNGTDQVFTLDKKLSQQLNQLIQAEGVTPFLFFLAAFKVLLYRYEGQKDIIVGSPIANRTQSGIEHLIGFFVNTIPLRTDLSGNPSFQDLLAQLKMSVLEDFDYQDVPFEKIVDQVVDKRDLSRSPLFQVMFSYEANDSAASTEASTSNAVEELSGLIVASSSQEKATATKVIKFDLSLSISEMAERFNIAVEYCTDLFLPGTMNRMLEHYQALLTTIVSNPKEKIDQLTILQAAEKQELLTEFGQNPFANPAGETLVSLFEKQAALTPDNIALEFEAESLNYQTLNEQANQLANYLASQGVAQEDLVCICVDRSIEMVVGILGIMKAGAAYVPIDPNYPEQRITHMLEDTQAKIVLTTSSHQGLFTAEEELQVICLDDLAGLANQSIAAPVNAVLPTNLAYVMYTSGSTGKPKGVQIEQGAITNEICYLHEFFGLGANERILQTGNFVFDLSVEQIFNALLFGGTLILPNQLTVLDTAVLEKLIDEKEITHLHATPSFLQTLTAKSYSKLKVVISGGEACSVELAQTWSAHAKFFNMYGPTEASIISTGYLFNEHTLNLGAMPIGKPVGNAKLYILDPTLELVPKGMTGELYIGGKGLARAYLNRPALTEEKFIASPFNEGERLYRTGDMVAWLPDGNIAFKGRIDNQVKIRGQRVELGEIEAKLLTAPTVLSAIVVAQSSVSGMKRLVAYVVVNGEYDKSKIITYLKTQLPDYMVPSIMMELEHIPLTVNGKVDKKALPEVSAADLLTNEYVAPRNNIEATIVNIWKELLGIDKIGVHDDFFELGGHSLLATRMVSAIRSELSMELPIKEVFLNTTVASQAEWLATQPMVTILPAIIPQERPAKIPLSFAQERLWFIDQLGGSVNYHMPMIHRFGEDLDIEALEYAFKETVNRHEVLRTVFLTDNGEPYQSILPRDQWTLSYEEYPTNESAEWLEHRTETEVVKAFDLTKDHMVRARVIKLENREYLLILVVHHIASDGWSQPIFFGELLESYEARKAGRTPELKSLSIQYADYAIWERKHLSGDLLEQKMSYWETKLQGVEVLDFPTDFIRPSIQSTNGSSFTGMLSKDLVEQLKTLSQEKGVTMFMLTLTIFKVLLHKYTGQVDIAVGSAIANRTQAEVEGLIGFFVNALTLRSDLADNPRFDDLLEQVKITTLEAYHHQEVPFEKIVDRLVVKRDMSITPLFQVLFAYTGMTDYTTEVDSNELPVVADAAKQTVVQTEASIDDNFDFEVSKFDMTFNILETEEGIGLTIQYCTDLFLPTTIERVAYHFELLLSAIVASPEAQISTFNILPEAEINQLLLDFNDSERTYNRETTLVDLLQKQVALTPDQAAIVFKEETISYRTLAEKSNQLAQYLKENGVESEAKVCLCLNRSIDLVVSILAVLKVGATYVPIDPNYPMDRIAYILGDTAAKVLVTVTGLTSFTEEKEAFKVVLLDREKDHIEQYSTDEIVSTLKPTDIAYTIYTSGSTGNPKGVLIQHQSVINLVNWHVTLYEVSETSKATMMAGVGFDVSVWELWPYLLSGATIYVLEDELRLSADRVFDFYQKNQVTHSFLPTVLVADFISFSRAKALSLQYLVTGGDSLGPIDMTNISYRLFNNYGPTENTVITTAYEVQAVDQFRNPPIGKPVDNVSLLVLDIYDRFVPIGVIGELCIAGESLAVAYLNKEELSATKFVDYQMPNDETKRIYRTGDLVRWLPDGNLAFVGRKDAQVQIRGYRVELGEIEAKLQACDLVNSGVVLAKKDELGNQQLIAYIVANGVYHKEGIQTYLKTQLPSYMIPSVMMELEELPLTANGKIDKRALPAPTATELSSVKFVAPRNETEASIAEIWGSLLQLEKVGVEDDFFELGGHSLLAIRVVSAIRKTFSKEIPVRVVFEETTISKLALYITINAKQSSTPAIVLEERPALIPLSFAQERLWFIDQLGGSINYHMPMVHRFGEDLDITVLEYAFKEIINRHEVLRTVFLTADGEPYQLILPKDQWTLGYEEYPTNESADWLENRIESAVVKAFDLTTDHMVRAQLIKLENGEYLLILVLHHIATDGWSQPIFFEELLELYEARKADRVPALKPLTVQYADYAIWQRKYLSGDLLAEKMSYWENKLQGVEVLDLPTDFVRPSIQSTNGSSCVTMLDKDLSQQLKVLAQEKGVTMFMLMLTSFKVLLYKYTGQADIAVGSVIANRTQAEIEDLIGFFVNTLTLRSDLGDNPRFLDVLDQVKTTTLEAYNHQEVPFEKIVDRLVVKRDRSNSALFQVLFAYAGMNDYTTESEQNETAIIADHAEAAIVETEASNTAEDFAFEVAKFDLTFNVSETENGLGIVIQYCTDLFLQSTIERMLSHFKVLISSIVTNTEEQLDQLKMLSTQEEEKLLSFSDQLNKYPQEETLVSLFATAAKKSKNSTAVVFGNDSLTYEVLDERSNQLANYLRAQGVKEESLVCICLERSLDMIIGVLGILKAGAAYVPIDPSYPADRISYTLEDSAASLVITTKVSADVLPTTSSLNVVLLDEEWEEIEQASTAEVVLDLESSNLAYVIYTSGSTGLPKGVLVEHRNVVSLFRHEPAIYNFTEQDVWTLFHSFCFDFSVWEIFGALLHGGKLVVVPKAITRDTEAFADLLVEEKVTVLNQTPGAFYLLQESYLLKNLKTDLRYVIFGGEALSPRKLQAWHDCYTDCQLINMYGITETTVHVTYKKLG